MPEESAVGATARATIRAGRPRPPPDRGDPGTGGQPEPAAVEPRRRRRQRLPGVPRPAAAFSAENVNTAVARLPTWYVGSPVTPRGSSRTCGTERPVASRAAAASATSWTSGLLGDLEVAVRGEVGQLDEVGRGDRPPARSARCGRSAASRRRPRRRRRSAGRRRRRRRPPGCAATVRQRRDAAAPPPLARSPAPARATGGARRRRRRRRVGVEGRAR